MNNDLFIVLQIAAFLLTTGLILTTNARDFSKLIQMPVLSFFAAHALYMTANVDHLIEVEQFYQNNYPIITSPKEECAAYDTLWAREVSRPGGKQEFCGNYHRMCN